MSICKWITRIDSNCTDALTKINNVWGEDRCIINNFGSTLPIYTVPSGGLMILHEVDRLDLNTVLRI